MKLFRRRPPQAGPANSADATPAPVRSLRRPNSHLKFREAPNKNVCWKNRLIQESIEFWTKSTRTKLPQERALNARRIIEFPHGDSGQRHVIQDKHGFWRIVPGLASASLKESFDAL